METRRHMYIAQGKLDLVARPAQLNFVGDTPTREKPDDWARRGTGVLAYELSTMKRGVSMRSLTTVRQVSEILTSCSMYWQGCQTYIDVSHARILTWIPFRAQWAVTPNALAVALSSYYEVHRSGDYIIEAQKCRCAKKNICKAPNG